MSFFIINASSVNLYREPDFNSAMVSQALLGETCDVLDVQQRWIKIRQWDDYEAWVHRFHGVVSDKVYESNLIFKDMFGVVLSARSGVTIRDLTFGCQVAGTQVKDGFTVTLPDGKKGWSNGRLSNSYEQATRDNIVKLARRFLGTPYHWCGKSPGGMDCSGLVQTVFRAVGISLPRDVYQQADVMESAKIELEKVKPGDLLFFSETGQMTHVAISTGGLGFVHSQGWVKEESLDKLHNNYNKNLKQLLRYVVSVKHLLTA